MTVVAIVVAYDAGSELRDAVAAYREANVPVVVVDNGPNSLVRVCAGMHRK